MWIVVCSWCIQHQCVGLLQTFVDIGVRNTYVLLLVFIMSLKNQGCSRILFLSYCYMFDCCSH
uniref:Uncharacterized protein n=1 Tax=Arundo donax TaxID=35708 RepID=A0A0A9H4A1_ARUDO